MTNNDQQIRTDLKKLKADIDDLLKQSSEITENQAVDLIHDIVKSLTKDCHISEMTIEVQNSKSN